MNRIGIIGAMDEEVNKLKEHMSDIKVENCRHGFAWVSSMKRVVSSKRNRKS